MYDYDLNNVENLHVSAVELLNNVVIGGGESSADSILNNLKLAIENLKKNWNGIDAGIRIQELIKVYNSMVVIRNTLAQLAVDSSKIAAKYREIQNANGAGLETFTTLSFENKTILEDYFDTADTVKINGLAESGRRYVEMANNSIDSFKVAVESKYEEIMQNWKAGPGRNNAQSAFDTFKSNVSQYKQILTDVSSNIGNALKNYSI